MKFSNNIRQSSTVKKEPKKTFSYDNNQFPELNHTANIENGVKKLDFVNATKKKITDDTEVNKASDLLPGWVYIRRNNGKIEYKYSNPSQRYFNHTENDDRNHSIQMFNYRVARDQYEIDNDIARLGDLSEYYGDKSLYECYAEEYMIQKESYEQVYSEEEIQD